MRWLIESLVTLIINAFALILDIFGTSVVSILTLEIGTSGGSIFDIVFSTMGDFAKLFQVLASGLLIINYIWQLVRIMMTSEGVSETPASLTARTFAAGVGIALSGRIVRVIQYFFSVFYNALLAYDPSGAVIGDSWTNFAGWMIDTIANPDNLVTDVLLAGVDSLVAGIITLIFMLFIGWEFIMFMAEIVERYILLGILYYTSPLAFSVAGSKSTGTIFTNWFRMLISQMLLMCFNVIFLSLFLFSFKSYGAALEAMREFCADTGRTQYSTIGLAIVWNMMMYGILYVGTKIDSYMATLGLSTAQTGRGLGAAIATTAFSVTRMIGTGSRMVRGVYNTGKGAATQISDQWKDTHRPATGDAKTDVKNLLSNKSSDTTPMRGTVAADGLMGILKDRKMNTAAWEKNLDKTSVTADPINGITGKTLPNKNGQTTDFQVVSAKTDEDAKRLKEQRCTYLGSLENGEKLFLAASGPAAQALLTANTEFDKFRKDWDSGKNQTSRELKNGQGEPTGVYEFTRTDPKTGEVKEQFQLAPASIQSRDTLSPRTQEMDIGDMTYYKTDTLSDACGNATMPVEPPVQKEAKAEDKAAYLNQQFADGSVNASKAEFNPDGTIRYTDEATGNEMVMAPATHYSAQAGSAVDEVTTQDGATYLRAPVNQERISDSGTASGRSSADGANAGQEYGSVFKVRQEPAGDVAHNISAPAPGPAVAAMPYQVASHLNTQFPNQLEAQKATYHADGAFTYQTKEGEFAAVPVAKFDARPEAANRQYQMMTAKNGATYAAVQLRTNETVSDVFAPRELSSQSTGGTAIYGRTKTEEASISYQPMPGNVPFGGAAHYGRPGVVQDAAFVEVAERRRRGRKKRKD